MSGGLYLASNPVGSILDTATKAYGLGKAIRRGPELEKREDEEYESGKKQRERQAELDDIKLTQERKKKGFEESTRELTGILNGLNSGELDPNDPSVQDRFHRAGINANVPMDLLGKPELDDHLGTLAGAVHKRDYKDPKALQSLTAINPLLQTGSGSGETKSFRALVPSKNGGFHADLNITGADGKTRTAPLTDRRSSDERDPITEIPLDSLVGHIAATHEFNEAVKSDPNVQAAVAGIQADPKSKDRYVQTIRARLATIQGKEYDPETDALAKREARAKVESAEQRVDTEKARAESYRKGRKPTQWEEAQDAVDAGEFPDLATAFAAKSGRRGAGAPVGTERTKGAGAKADPEAIRGDNRYKADLASWDKNKGRDPSQPGKKLPRPDRNDPKYPGATPASAAAPAAPAKPSADMKAKLSGGLGTKQKPVQVKTPDEALQYPSGTYFLTPDGRKKIVP